MRYFSLISSLSLVFSSFDFMGLSIDWYTVSLSFLNLLSVQSFSIYLFEYTYIWTVFHLFCWYSSDILWELFFLVPLGHKFCSLSVEIGDFCCSIFKLIDFFSVSFILLLSLSIQFISLIFFLVSKFPVDSNSY